MSTGPYTVTPSKIGGNNNAINSFDAAKIAGHVTGIATLSGNQRVVADVSGNNIIQSFDAALIARFVTASGASGSTGTWRFYTVPNVPFPPGTTPTSRTYPSVSGDLTGEDYTALLMGEVSGNWTNTGARPAGGEQLPATADGPERGITVDLPHTASAAGGEIVIPVIADGAANKGIVSYEFNLRYDPSVIRPVGDGVETTGTASRGLIAVANPKEPGLLRVAVYGAMPIDDNGVLLNLKFTAVGTNGTTSPLTWERIMFNDGDMQTMSVDGQIEIVEP
jgi:hypothetical protein